MSQTSLDFDVKRQTTFTLDDVEYDNGIDLNVTFIDYQRGLSLAIDWLKYNQTQIGVDIETRGLDPYQHELIMFQFGDQYRQFVIDTRKVDITGILPYLDGRTIIGQNLKFEYKFIKHNHNVLLDSIKDTMIQEKCLYNGKYSSYSLKALAKRYLNYEADKSIRMRFLEIGDKPFSKDEIIYGAYDVILPMLINEQQEIAIKEKDKQRLVDLEHEMVKVLGDLEYKGLYFDKEKWEQLYTLNLLEYEIRKQPLDEFIFNNNLEEYIKSQVDMFDSTKKVSLSWSSPKQVVGLFTSLGICPKAKSKTTKLMAYTVEAKVLKVSLLTTNKDVPQIYKDFIKEYIAFKEYEQRVTTFGIKFFKHVNPVTGRLHSNYNQIINTGRMSSSSPNLQNIPSDPRFRKCFTAPDGNKIVNADYSGQETVILANKSLEPSMVKLISDGNDMHCFVARHVFPEIKELDDFIIKRDHGDKRGSSKGAGFAINYGGTGFTIAMNQGIEVEEGDRVYEAYFRAFPELKTYFDKCISDTLERGYILINEVSNRTFELKDYDLMMKYKKMPARRKSYETIKGAIGRLALNYPVQGTAGDVTKSAAIKFRKWIYDNKLEELVFITNIIHDEINAEAPIEIAQKVADALEKAMEEAGAIWCKDVPLKAEAQIGDFWAH